MKNLLIVLAVTTVSFLAGGGWKFFSSEEMYGLWHNVHSDWEFTWTYLAIFTMFGIAQAIGALFWSVLIIRLWPMRQRFAWLWAFLLTSIVFGGYKFFVVPPEYFLSTVTGKQSLSLPLWCMLPFLTNGGGAGLVAGCIVAIMQKVRQQKRPNPNQVP